MLSECGAKLEEVLSRCEDHRLSYMAAQLSRLALQHHTPLCESRRWHHRSWLACLIMTHAL